MGLAYENPQTITVNNDWVRSNVMKFGNEALTCDEEDILSEWCHEDFVIRVICSCDYILWVARYNNQPVGAGSFSYNGVIREGIQAVLPKYQRRGIYSSVIEFLLEWAGPIDIENDPQQTVAMQIVWEKLQTRNSIVC